ncbi:hypothetical protein N7468_001358 [Penicillium chermesinum]|uniref:Zn(2)-C6 fungal-type domain-containing protein n=1 Tax=Penicillium chermesinum TaxID=63820 RepID=A0A9W9PGN5_9EURO|nr:uncharacterized protein N7468_001358 [Penicillium chermesinum]KAJ5246375.1 hypothetical protein N7468_001358 [Penicillium chermesinum]
MAPDAKPKNRPQQSCLKCRERKIKCDRSIPCSACTSRGLETECVYLTTPEDRAHISQAEIIERLRREVAQLRTQLTQTPPRGPSPKRNSNAGSHNWTPYARPQDSKSKSPDVLYGASGAPFGYNAAAVHGAGPGSAPEGQLLRICQRGAVASPGSTESDSGVGVGVGGMSQPVYQAGAGFTMSSPNLTGDIPTSHCPPGDMTALAPGENPNPMPMQGAQVYTHPAPQPYPMNEGVPAPYMNNEYPTHDQHYHEKYQNMMNDYEARAFHSQWGQQQFIAAPPLSDSAYYSSSPPAPFIGGYAPKHQGADVQPPSAAPQFVDQNTRSSISSMAQSVPSPWKGEGKQELLETLFRTIGSCSEENVAQVVQVVRNSATPEDAVSGICQVLGIGGSAR